MRLYRLVWAGPGYRRVADACVCGYEPSGSVKCGEFLEYLQNFIFSRRTLHHGVSKLLIKFRNPPFYNMGTSAVFLIITHFFYMTAIFKI